MRFCLFLERPSEAYPQRLVECCMCVWAYQWWDDTVPYVPSFNADQLAAMTSIREHAQLHRLRARVLLDVIVP